MKHNHKLFIDTAVRVAAESTATRLKVGAVIAKDGSFIDVGYNGTPAGWHTNECEAKQYAPRDAGGWMDPTEIEESWPLVDDGYDATDIFARYTLVTKPEVIHAEMNALMKCAKLGKPVGGATLYVTHAPCEDCAKHIIAAGIAEVVYLDKYKSTVGLEILAKSSVKVTKWG